VSVIGAPFDPAPLTVDRGTGPWSGHRSLRRWERPIRFPSARWASA